MTGHLIRRIWKDEETGRDHYGPYKPCTTCGPLDVMTIGLLGDYLDLKVQRDEVRQLADEADEAIGADEYTQGLVGTRVLREVTA